MITATATGTVSQVFSTLQGEGLRVGERQIFIRLAGCPWRCVYCDTPDSLSPQGHPSLSVEDVLNQVQHLQEERPHKVASVTGGEPLTQVDFLKALLPALQGLGLKTYLETSGTHPQALEKIVAHCNIIAMDIKLPSALGREFWEEHAVFLKIAGDRVFTKLVLTADTTDEEMEKTVRLLAENSPAPPLILQPVTPLTPLEQRLKKNHGGPVLKPPSAHRLTNWWEWCRQRLPDVRLIPQMHPHWNVP